MGFCNTQNLYCYQLFKPCKFGTGTLATSKILIRGWSELSIQQNREVLAWQKLGLENLQTSETLPQRVESSLFIDLVDFASLDLVNFASLDLVNFTSLL